MKRDSKMNEINATEYYDRFIKGKSKEDIKYSYEKAWSAKNFEIDNYWKRAAYFWAFQVASFAGFFSILNSNLVKTNTDISFYVICIGFLTSLAWFFTNKGSKSWQRNWELHVDMLENYVTGPLYKTVGVNKTYSVSKINELISQFFILIWFILGVKYWISNKVLIVNIKVNDIYIISVTLLVLTFTIRIIFFYGRGRFQKKKNSVKFYTRYDFE